MIDEVFVFPYEKIEKGSRIVIFGFGHVGMSYRVQIDTIQYCEVVGFCASDPAIDRNGDMKYRLIRKAELQTVIENEKIDYVVIALNVEASAKRMKKELVEMYGVEENKVIVVANRKMPIHVLAKDLEYFMRSYEHTKKCIDEFYQQKDGNVDYFADIVKEIRQTTVESRKDIYRYLIQYATSTKSLYHKIAILRILYGGNMFSDECMKLYFDVAKDESISNEARVWLLYDICVFERNNENCRNKTFYIDKRNLIAQCTSAYVKENEFVNEKSTNRKECQKVAVVSFGLGGEQSSHNGLIVPYVNEMCKQGKQVVIFPVDLLRYRYGEGFIMPIEPVEMDAEIHIIAHQKIFDDSVQIKYAEGESMKDRTRNFMQNLCEYNPDIVLDFSGEYAFYSHLYYSRYFTIAIPMRGFSCSNWCDVYISRNRDLCLKENQVYGSLREEQIEEGLICSVPQQAQKQFLRLDYNIPESAFVMVTVGHRLKTELTSEFIKVVCKFLKEHEDAIWILVGNKTSDVLYEQYSDLINDRRIIMWGLEGDLPGMYNLCDIYWNPDRMGAGGSIGTAMRCGLPIVTTRFPSDVLPRLGIENAVDGGYEECAKYVQQLYEDKNLYEKQSQLMKDRMKISTIKNYIEHVFEIASVRMENEK